MKKKNFFKKLQKYNFTQKNMSKCLFFMKDILHVQVVPILTIAFILTNTFCISVRQCYYFKC